MRIYVPDRRAEWLLFPVAEDPGLGKQVMHFRFIFTDREARGKNKQKMPKSPRTNTPGERKALRSKAWSEVTLLISAEGVFQCDKIGYDSPWADCIIFAAWMILMLLLSYS